MEMGRRVGAVVLGAGAASRMGRSKLTLPYGDSDVIGSILGTLRRSVVTDVVVVTGYHADEVEASIGGVVATTRNPDPDRGNVSSLVCGLDALDESIDGVVVVLGDMPGISVEVIDGVVGAFARGITDAVVPVYLDGWGHPIVASRGLIDIVDRSADQPLWRAIKELDPTQRHEFVVDSPKPVDINTPLDHETATGGHEPA